MNSVKLTYNPIKDLLNDIVVEVKPLSDQPRRKYTETVSISPDKHREVELMPSHVTITINGRLVFFGGIKSNAVINDLIGQQ